MTRTKGGKISHPPVQKARPEADDELNEKFHSLLRDAAEKRESRAIAQSTEDGAAARSESADLLALARSQGSGRGDDIAR